MKKLFTISVLLMFSTAQAQGLQVIPKWTFTGSQACYGFDDAKKLVELDSELVLCREEGPKLRLVETQLRIAIDELNTALTARNEQNTILTTEVNKCFDDKKDLVRRVHEAEARESTLTTPLLAGGIGLAVGILLGLLFTQ